ncbi:unnamed protein product [Cunninghamella blakesleeana]
MLDKRKPFSANTSSTNNDNNNKNSTESSSTSQQSTEKGIKRKFEDEVSAIKEKEIQRVTEKVESSKSSSSNAKLKSSFWLPTMTPKAEIQKHEEIKAIQTQPLCYAVKESHPLTMKGLIEVKFHKDSDDKSTCPACLKSLSNSIKISVMRHCGHVICQNCVDMFVKKTKKCYVCEEKTKSKDIIEMSAEGTGYASKNSVGVAERFDLSFH